MALVARFDTCVQLAVTLPCPSNCSAPATSRTLITEAPERALPVALKGVAGVAAVPEVSSLTLLGTLVCLIMFLGRFRRKRSANLRTL